MGLVDYSDSEGSDEDTRTATTPPATTAKPKAINAKVVDRTESGKIRVALPELKSEASNSPEDTLEVPAAKRPRTGGVFSGFSSLLPPPKNAGKKAPSASGGYGGVTASSSNGNIGGRGVSLRTGAAPAFDRTTQRGTETQISSASTSNVVREEEEEDASAKPTAVEESEKLVEPKLVGKPLMFKPLSVSRKSQAKKKRPPAATQMTNGNSQQSSAAIQAPQSQPVKAKVSLFGKASTELVEEGTGAPTSGYKPLLQDNEEDSDDALEARVMNTASNGHAIPQQTSGNELKAVADSLDLTASERRQLFGRKGQPSDAQIAQFSLAEEYQNNNKMRDDDSSAPQLNPVKSIAPGKHSLQQLVNAATGQKDALEDAFAQGRKNKRDAGTRYGWA